MVKKAPTGVRLSDTQEKTINGISSALGCSNSDIIRYAIDLLSAAVNVTMDIRHDKYGIEIAGSSDGFTVAANDPRNTCLSSTLFLGAETLADVIILLNKNMNGYGKV